MSSSSHNEIDSLARSVTSFTRAIGSNIPVEVSGSKGDAMIRVKDLALKPTMVPKITTPNGLHGNKEISMVPAIEVFKEKANVPGYRTTHKSAFVSQGVYDKETALVVTKNLILGIDKPAARDVDHRIVMKHGLGSI